MSYANTLNGIGTLGALSKDTSKLIQKNKNRINKILKRAEKLNGLGYIDKYKGVIPASEVIKRYNAGISTDEIKAWVWYRRSIGIPMTGWEKYYIDKKNGGIQEDMLKTIAETTIKDNHWRDLKIVPSGTIIGKQIGEKEHKYDKSTYIFFRDSEGIKIVNKKHVAISKSEMKTDEKELERLAKVGALYYLKGELLPYPVYAYGNMYDRELALKEDKEAIVSKFGQNIYENHLKVINENKPKQLSILNPDVNDRMQILAISNYADNFKIEGLKDDAGVSLNEPASLKDAYVQWLRTLNRSEFETGVSAYDIIRYYIRGGNLPKDMEKSVKTEFKSNIRNEGEEKFKIFLHEALLFEDQQKLDFDWNRKYNGQSNVAHHKIPIGFKMSTKFKGFDLEIRPPQREGIAFMELVGSGIIAYDVGVGKTITAIIELANALNSGKCERPLIVVPNPTYKNWILEIIGEGQGNEGVLTGTGVTINDWYNLGSKILPTIKLNKKVPEKSITIVTYEGMKKIGFGNEVGEGLFTELVNILSQSEDEESKSQRDIERDYQKYWEKIGVGLKGTVADIDVLGFDYIVIDEAHRVKNVFNGVRKDKNGKRRFGTQGGQSDVGIKAFFINNYLQRKYGRNIMLLTATPFTNSPLEVFSMLSHVAYQGLRDMGYYNIQDFFEQFVLETTVDAVNYKEEIVQKDVVKSFNNRLILSKLIYNHINYKTGEEAGVKRPCKINLPKVSELTKEGYKKLPPSKQILTYLKMTNRQRANQNRITDFARSASNKRGGGDILRAMNFSLNNALSPYLFDHEEIEDYKHFVNESPKIKYACEAIRTVKQYHEAKGEECSEQIIYMNRGTDYFHYIKQYLEEEIGFKKAVKWNKFKVDEVEILDGSVSNTKKERVKDAFNAGAVKVIIGTATIREGINLQKKTTVVYNLYPDWNPTDLRQLEGRAWRYGNIYGYVRIVMPLVQDSMDVFVFQKIEEKTNRINDIWYKGDRGNVLDLESLDPEDVKYALLTDIEAIAQTVINKEIKKANRKVESIAYQVELLRGFTQQLSYMQNYRTRLLGKIKQKYNEFGDFDYIRTRPAKEQIKKMEKNKRKLVETDLKFYDEITAFIEKTPIEDKEILAIARKMARRFDYFDSYYISNFAEYLSKVKKAEKTVLNAKGYTIDDDINKVIEEYKKDKDKAIKAVENIKSKKYREQIIEEVKEKKSAMRISGKSIIERVEEFANLNYLLDYKFSQINYNSCIIPKQGGYSKVIKNKKPNNDKKMKLMALKAKALKLKLELLEL